MQTTAARPHGYIPKPDRLAPYDSAKMHFGGLELAWRGARDRLQGCKREDDRRKKRRRRMTTERQVWERRKLGPYGEREREKMVILEENGRYSTEYRPPLLLSLAHVFISWPIVR